MPEQAEKDKQRTNELKAMNLAVVRICNLDVDRNFCGVCEHIDRLVQNSFPQSALLTGQIVKQVQHIQPKLLLVFSSQDISWDDC